MGTSVGGCQLRYNYYPMIPDINKVKPGQIRCGEHTDYGGITLLIQDDAGGLEVGKIVLRKLNFDDFVLHQPSATWFSNGLSKSVNMVEYPIDRCERF